MDIATLVVESELPVGVATQAENVNSLLLVDHVSAIDDQAGLAMIVVDDPAHISIVRPSLSISTDEQQHRKPDRTPQRPHRLEV